MAKRNLIKGIVCGLMLTTVLGTTGFAATKAVVQVENNDYVYEVESYYNMYNGTYGNFYAKGETNLAKTEVVNDTYAQRGYALQVKEFNYGSQTITRYDYDEVVLNVYGSSYVSIFRDFDYPGTKYTHTGKSFSSPGTTSVVIDQYECTLYQYR